MTYGSILVAVLAEATGDPTPEIRQVLADEFRSVGRTAILNEELPRGEAVQTLRTFHNDHAQLLRFYFGGKRAVFTDT